MANIDVKVILSAVDHASGTLRKFGAASTGVHRKFAGLVKASTIGSAAFAGALALTGKSIIGIASDMQQAKVAFDTMLGSAEESSKLLRKVAAFAAKTAFDLPGVI